MDLLHKTGTHGPMKDDSVDLAALHDQLGDGYADRLGIEKKCEIDGVGRGTLLRDKRPDLFLKLRRENRHLQTTAVAGIGHRRPWPAGIGDHADTFPPQGRLCRQGPADPVKVFDGADADDPGLLKEAVVEMIGPCHRSGMAGTSPCTGSRTAHILGQNRLVRRNPARYLQKARRILQPLDIEGDRSGLFIFSQIRKSLVNIDINFITKADRFAEANPPPAQQPQGLGDIGAALRSHPQQPRGADERHYRNIKGEGAVQQADAVGPEKADPVAPGDLFQLFLQSKSFAAGLSKTGRNHHRPFGPDLAKIVHQADHLIRGHDKDG